jgi:hypothetical protein
VSSKHYGIDGVGTLVELGKGGPKINNAAGVVEVKNNANNAYADLTAFKATVDSIQLALAPTVGDYAEGHLFYDATWKTLSAEIGRDVTLQIGQEDLRRVYNNTGVTIYNGQAVYATGVYSGGTNNVITVALAKADSATTAFVVGCSTQDISNNDYGFVTVRGHINGLDTNHIGSAYLSTQGMVMDGLVGGTAGNAYTFTVVDTTSGGLTYTEVGGAIIVDLGGTTPTRAQVATLINTTTPSAYIQVHVETAGNVIVASVLPFGGGVATTAGDVLYLSAAVPGKLRVGVPDSPNLEIRVGRLITKSATVGRVNIRIYQGYRINDLSDVSAPSPAIDDQLVWNGMNWISRTGVTVSGSAGIDFFADDASIISTGPGQSAYAVEALLKIPRTIAEQPQVVEATTTTTSPKIIECYLYNSALGRTQLDAGTWTVNTYCSVNGASGTPQIDRNVYRVIQGVGTLVMSSTGTTRTATASTGTPFAAGDGTADVSTCGYLQTPDGIFPITTGAVGGDAKVAAVTTLVGYTNEGSSTPIPAGDWKVWKRLFGVNTGNIAYLSTNYGLIPKQSVQGVHALTADGSDRLGEIVFGRSTSTSRIIYYVHNGEVNASNFRTPLITLHNNMSGLNAVGGNYQHLTDANHTALTGGGATTLHTHAVPTTITVAAEATDISSFPLLVTASTGDLGPKTSSGWGLSTAHAYTGTGTATSGLPRMFLGTNAPSGDDSALLICRAVAGTDLFSHAFRDESTFTSLNTGAYASFDSIPVLNGDITYNHIVSFQSRHRYAGGGTLTDSVGFTYVLTTSGAVTASTAFRVYDYAGVGVVTNFYALYIPTLTKPTNHWTIYSTGTSKAYHAGNFGIGTTNPLSLLSVSGDTAARTVFQDGNNGQVTISSPSASADTVTKITFSTPSYGGAGGNAGIGVKWTAVGTEMMFGTSNTYTGISNTALTISNVGLVSIPAGVVLGFDATTPTGNTAGYLKMFSAGDNAYYTTFTAGTQTANATYTLPTAMPTVSGQVFTSTDAGVTSWSSLGVSVGGTGLTAYPAKSIILPAASAALGTTTPATRETRELTTNKQVLDVLKFAHAGVCIAWWSFLLPDSYDGGVINAKITYMNVATDSTNNFLFSLSAGCATDGNPLDLTMGTVQELETVVGDTAEDLKIGTWSTGVTPSGTPAGGKLLVLKLQRDPTDTAHDTTSLDAYVLGLRLEYTVNSWTD